MLSETNFAEAEDFSGGRGRVKTADGYNYVDTAGNLLTDQALTHIGEFVGGAAPCRQTDGQWNLIREDGTTVSTTGYDEVRPYFGGMARVKTDGKWYALDADGNTVGEGYREMGVFEQGLALVRTDTEDLQADDEGNTYDASTPAYNFMTTDGSLLLDTDADELAGYEGGDYVRVRRGDLWYYVSVYSGTDLADTGFTMADGFVGDLARVMVDGRFNLMDKSGLLLLDGGVDRLGLPSCGMYLTRTDGVYNFYSTASRGYISTDGYTDARDFEMVDGTPLAKAKIDDTWYYIGTDGEVVEELDDEEDNDDTRIEE